LKLNCRDSVDAIQFAYKIFLNKV